MLPDRSNEPNELNKPIRPISLIGAPTDIGAGARGASMGPEAMRVAGLQATLEAHGLEVSGSRRAAQRSLRTASW